MNSFFQKLRDENLHDFGHKTNHLEPLANLYADVSHFVFEILQNAEDAAASSVYFDLRDNELIIYHDGRPFNENDVRSITRISDSTKGDVPNSIGKFGLGFKSVYGVTNCPEIHSDKYHFCINDYIRPSQVDAIALDDRYTTLFRLPFKEEKKEQLFCQISERLRNLNLSSLIFLHNLKDIAYRTRDFCGEYLRDERKILDGLICINAIGQSDRGQIESKSFLVFSDKSNNGQRVEIAFLYDDKKGIVPIKNNLDTKLFVYFPTEKETKLSFLLNGNFKTTPARDNILENDGHNKALVVLAADLIEKAMEVLKEQGLCNVHLLESLPIQPSNFPIGTMFFPIFERTKRLLKERKFLPATSGNFIDATEAKIARSFDLIDLLPNNAWISKEITENKTRELFEYLSGTLGVKVITPETFARYISDGSIDLNDKSDEWFVRFYAFLDEHESLFKPAQGRNPEGILFSKAIFTTETNELKTKDEVFLPAENIRNDWPTIKSSIVANEAAMAFLQKHLRKPNKVDSIIDRISKKYTEPVFDIDDSEYESDLKDVLGILKGESLDDKKRIEDTIRDCRIIRCEDGIFRKAEEVYQPLTTLKEWFKYSNGVFFADIKIFNKNDMNLLNLSNLPRRIRTEEPPKCGWVYGSAGYGGCYRNNYKLHGAENFLDNLNINNVKDFSEIICASYDKEKDFFEAKEKYYYYRYNEKTYKNKICELLEDRAWILGKDRALYKPYEITKEDISEDVSCVRKLQLNFKSSKEKEIEDLLAEKGMCIVRKEDYNEYVEWVKKHKNPNKLQESKKCESNEKQWRPSCSPSNIKSFSTGKLDPIPEDRGSGNIYRTNLNKTLSFKGKNDVVSEKSVEDKKAVGKWGEEAVEKYLKEVEGVTEIKKLNTEDEIGTGRDFEVYRNNKLEKIIEVKSTTEYLLKSETFKISGKQWETGRRENDMYWIYIVFGAGSDNPEIIPIQNPIMKWKNGEIEANPVNFIIRRK